MTLSPKTWLERRNARAEQARLAARDLSRAPELLQAWRFSGRPGVLQRALADLEPPDSSDLRRLAAWIFGPTPYLAALPESSEEALDRTVLEFDATLPIDPTDRKAAALYLLARVGEELARRERRAWQEARWPDSAQDAEARAVWGRLLRNPPDFDASRKFRKLWGPLVKTAFAGVVVALRLPPDIASEHAKVALQQLDLMGLGAHFDLAARVVETADEPVEALAAALGPAALERVERCLARREGWSLARRLLEESGGYGHAAAGLTEGADLVVFQRIVAALSAGNITNHPLGLPGWGIVAANRSRMRGRLRAASREDLEALRARVMTLPGLFERTGAAVSRHAWEWAWREARTGFGFDPGRMHAPACTLETGADVQPVAPLGPQDDDAITTFLLLALGRGTWEDLERWLQGAPAHTLSKSFYRCLKQVPDRLADPMAPGQRVRRYQRLWDHLADNGIEAYVPRLQSVARRVAPIEPGRSMKQALHDALRPEWDSGIIPLPEHHLPTFQTSFAGFLSGKRTGQELAARDGVEESEER